MCRAVSRCTTALALGFVWFTSYCAASAQDAPNRAASAPVLESIARNRAVTVPAEVTKQGDEVVVQMKDRAIKVANPEALPSDVRQLPVQVVLTPNEDGNAELTRVDLQATRSWDEKSSRVKNRHANVTMAHEQLEVASDRALSPSATAGDLRQLSDSVTVAKQEVVKAYTATVATDRRERRLLVEQYRELQATGKALYGLDDRYPPAAYSKIFANSRGAFALVEGGATDARCSAVLVGTDLALTNNHCLLENIPEELEARFDYELDLEGNQLVQHTFPVVEFLIETEEARGGLDFALLRLGADQSGRLPGEHYKPECLSMRGSARDDALYVVGHPLGGPRTVHDNAFVYFPFRVTAEKLLELEILVRSEFDTSQEEDLSYREGKLKEFKDSYRLVNIDGEDVYEYYSVRFRQQPTIGADCDTYRGNSGSPVFNRRTHQIIGVLFDGQEDLSRPWLPGWRAHEAILPIEKIVEQIESVLPDWDAEGSGVCIVK